jgi:hypothetical protein
MPDITMCGRETCPLKTMCYRNHASGTRPSEFQKSWFMGLPSEGETCNHYWPREDRG